MNNQNEVDQFLGDLKGEEKNPFKLEVIDPFAQSDKEEKKDDKKDGKEVELPFHRDPKVQRFIEKEIDKRMSSVEPKIIEREVLASTDTDSLTDVLTRIIGNDTPEKISAIKDFQIALASREERIRQEALDEIDRRVDEEKEAEIEATNELVEGFESIEDTFKVDITSDRPSAVATRKEFVDFIQRIAPKDEDGQVVEFPDLEETFRLFQDTKKGAQPSNRARELASRSIDRSSDSTVTPESTDKSWSAVEKWLNKLSS